VQLKSCNAAKFQFFNLEWGPRPLGRPYKQRGLCLHQTEEDTGQLLLCVAALMQASLDRLLRRSLWTFSSQAHYRVGERERGLFRQHPQVQHSHF